MNWSLLILGICSFILALERVWRLRDEPATLTQRSINAVLFAVGIAVPAYSNAMPESALYPFTQAVWHIGVCALVGALELTFFTLRVEDVPKRTVVRIVAQSGIVAALLIIGQKEALARSIPEEGIERFADHDLASVIYLIIFPAYVIWALSQPVIWSIPRIPRDLRRRPINTLALLLVAAGLGGFIIINIVLSFMLSTGRGESKSDVIVFSSVSLAVCIAGAVILAGGERLYDEIVARHQLAQLNTLWQRLIDLSDDDLHLPDEHLSTPARLQRAYVEISDAICSLRLHIEGRPTVDSVVAALRRGAVAHGPEAATISSALPARTTRREDLELIGALAKTYREGTKSGASATRATAGTLPPPAG